MEFIEGNRIKVDPPKKPKKLTATRFATVMGLNAWSTPFAAWCEMTRTYEEPFSDSIYTVAGKVIEPKICEYLRNRYFMEIKSPTDVYGADYFKKTWGDFFPAEDALGGMWDFLGDDFVVEVKTTKRAEDWRGADGKVEPPIYYKLQAALYAYLLGFDDVVMTCSFLEEKDYPIDRGDGTFDTTPTEAFIPNVKNTVVVEFKVSEDFPTFRETYVEPALKFWRDHVMTGISPEFDEKRDAEILKVLRKNTVEPTDGEISKLIAEADKLQSSIDKAEEKIAEKKKRLKEIDDQVKKYMSGQFRDGDKKVEIAGKKYTWTLTRSERNSLDQTALKKDLPDVFGKYVKKSETLTLKKSLIEEV
jgi:predicted phage-related endonuclease